MDHQRQHELNQVHNNDANTFRGGVSGGGGRGGGISLTAEGYGPVALYVGGTGKVELKDFAISDLGLRVRTPEVTSPDFRKQTLNDFYYGWGQDAADFNHDGHLDIVSGPYIYYGPDFTHYREYFRGEAVDPTNDFAMDAHEVFAGNFTGHANWPDVITVKSTCMSQVHAHKGVFFFFCLLNRMVFRFLFLLSFCFSSSVVGFLLDALLNLHAFCSSYSCSFTSILFAFLLISTLTPSSAF